MALNYLLDPVFQIENSAGKPATDGWLEVYIHGTRTKYYCASDFNGTLHPFKIPLDSLGSNIVLAEDGQSYDVYAYNRFGSLLMSRYNVTPGKGGGSGGNVGEMQHWLGMYGPSYTPFPGDLAGHTLGISKWEVDYVGDFIDHISTCPYPDGTTPRGYIYLKPGLYYVSCIIRYQQASDALSNTLDEILIYTGAGNANESLAYQMDSSGPEATGNRHNIRVQFIRRVPDNVSSSILYFAPGTPVDWKEAYIQKLEIIKLDSVAVSPTIVQGLEKVHHDETLVGDGTVANPLGVDSDSVQKKLIPGDGIAIDSDGVISAEGEKYNEGWGILIDSDNEISVDPSIIQKKITAGDGIQIDSDGTISADLPEEEEVEFEELNLDDYQKKLTAGEHIYIDSDNVISATGLQKELTADYGIDLDSDGNIGVDPNIIPELPPILPLVAGENVTIEDSDGVVVISADGGGSTYTAGEGINITSDGVISADLPEEEEVEFEELDLDDYQKKLTAGQGIELDSDGNISATGEPCLWFLDSDGYVQPKDGKQFEVYGAPSYETYWDYYFAKINRVRSDNVGLRVDYMVASHRGDASTPFGPFNVSATLRTDHSAHPYQGSRKAGLVLDDNQTGTGTNPRARIDMYAGSNGGYSVSTYKDQTYVQAIVANDYVRMRSDDIIRHVGSTDGHAPFVLVQQSDTTKKYVLQPTATAGIYELVEETSGGGTYTAGDGISIVNDVISVDSDSLPAGPQGPEGPQGPKGDTGSVPPGLNLVAGTNISITPSNNTLVISSTGGGSTYTAGDGINIVNDVISVDSDSLPAGPAGADGESAYEIWLDQGNTGSEQDFLDSLEGPQGPQGVQGIQGEQGPAGTVPPGLNLVAGDNISITPSGSTVTIGVTGVATTAQLSGKADSATTLAGYGITDAYTKTQVDNALNDKQNTLTGITDVQVVQSLPASPVATVLYLIPEV